MSGIEANKFQLSTNLFKKSTAAAHKYRLRRRNPNISSLKTSKVQIIKSN